MKAWSINGNTQRLDGGAMFGNVPRAIWEKWLAPDAEHRVPLACRALLVQLDDGRRVLFETGIGAFFDPKLRAR
ncbi:MAG: MBL fold metallo-hydrolase, partial [Rhodanobacteraceae bacterium]|nr:MBL fold metallo-hydrolase [Rhodanobacteraceae bacterium]